MATEWTNNWPATRVGSITSSTMVEFPYNFAVMAPEEGRKWRNSELRKQQWVEN